MDHVGRKIIRYIRVDHHKLTSYSSPSVAAYSASIFSPRGRKSTWVGKINVAFGQGQNISKSVKQDGKTFEYMHTIYPSTDLTIFIPSISQSRLSY